MSFRVPEHYRYPNFPGRESRQGDLHGCFLIKPSLMRGFKVALRCIASAGEDWERAQAAGMVAADSVPWEHVSVSIQPGVVPPRCPVWEEMCYVKTLFWEPEDCVIEFHPPASEYVNESAYCLHLWRPVGVVLPRPPSICVGVRK